MSSIRNLAKKVGLVKLKNKLNAHPKNIVFIWVPKNAGTSIYNALLKYKCLKLKSIDSAKANFPNKGVVTFQHLPYHKLIDMGIVKSSFDSDSIKFAVSRNPYDRAVSLYRYIKKIRGLADYNFESFCQDLQSNKIEEILDIHTGIIPIHRPQTDWLLDDKGELFVNHLVSMDNFRDDVLKVFKHLELEIDDIPMVNTSKTNKDSSIYESQEQINIVKSYYRKDFEHLGYSLELPNKYC